LTIIYIFTDVLHISSDNKQKSFEELSPEVVATSETTIVQTHQNFNFFPRKFAQWLQPKQKRTSTSIVAASDHVSPLEGDESVLNGKKKVKNIPKQKQISETKDPFPVEENNKTKGGSIRRLFSKRKDQSAKQSSSLNILSNTGEQREETSTLSEVVEELCVSDVVLGESSDRKPNNEQKNMILNPNVIASFSDNLDSGRIKNNSKTKKSIRETDATNMKTKTAYPSSSDETSSSDDDHDRIRKKKTNRHRRQIIKQEKVHKISESPILVDSGHKATIHEISSNDPYVTIDATTLAVLGVDNDISSRKNSCKDALKINFEFTNNESVSDTTQDIKYTLDGEEILGDSNNRLMPETGSSSDEEISNKSEKRVCNEESTDTESTNSSVSNRQGVEKYDSDDANDSSSDEYSSQDNEESSSETEMLENNNSLLPQCLENGTNVDPQNLDKVSKSERSLTDNESTTSNLSYQKNLTRTGDIDNNEDKKDVCYENTAQYQNVQLETDNDDEWNNVWYRDEQKRFNQDVQNMRKTWKDVMVELKKKLPMDDDIKSTSSSSSDDCHEHNYVRHYKARCNGSNIGDVHGTEMNQQVNINTEQCNLLALLTSSLATESKEIASEPDKISTHDNEYCQNKSLSNSECSESDNSITEGNGQQKVINTCPPEAKFDRKNELLKDSSTSDIEESSDCSSSDSDIVVEQTNTEPSITKINLLAKSNTTIIDDDANKEIQYRVNTTNLSEPNNRMTYPFIRDTFSSESKPLTRSSFTVKTIPLEENDELSKQGSFETLLHIDKIGTSSPKKNWHLHRGQRVEKKLRSGTKSESSITNDPSLFANVPFRPADPEQVYLREKFALQQASCREDQV
jgi:hypothetical protein